MDYKFIESEKLCKLDIEQVELNKVLEKYYTTHMSTIFVTKQAEPDHIMGIITLGDVLRYRKYKANIINKEFTYISKIDDRDINRIYKEKRAVCQLPIISDGILLGAVIFKDRENSAGIEDGFNRIYKSIFYQEQLELVSRDIVDVGAHMICCLYPDAERVLSANNIIRLGEKKKRYRDGQLGNLKEDEQVVYWGDEYYEGIGEDFQSDYDKISVSSANGIIKFQDLNSRFINIKYGKRITTNNPPQARKKLYIVGACFAFGAYVSDKRTIAYYLQERICDELEGQYQIINCGNMGDANLATLFCEQISTDDIVVVIVAHMELVMAIMNAKLPNSCKYYLLDEVFQNEDFCVDYLFNSLTHHNYKINHYISEYIYKLLAELDAFTDAAKKRNKEIQNYYIDSDVYLFFKKLIFTYGLQRKIENNNGSIVMNCNPFTKGHRFLVEKALEYAGHIFVFVVEEDASFFSFSDRFEMVKDGLQDLIKMGRVTVIPSGNYIISKETFAQYFEKEKNIEIINNMEYDVRIFAEIVCASLNISTRFVGKEPTDKITNEYNKTMKRILPLYDIRLVEFERLSENDGSIVSATKVREWLRNGEWENIEKVVPQSTYEILKRKF